MKGTQDILCVFGNGHKMSLSASDLDHANRWIEDNRDKLRMVHFGETAISYRDGRIVAQLHIPREQCLESI